MLDLVASSGDFADCNVKVPLYSRCLSGIDPAHCTSELNKLFINLLGLAGKCILTKLLPDEAVLTEWLRPAEPGCSL